MPYRIRDWDLHFENAASRKLKRLDWVAVPNKTDGSGYTALVDHPNGAAHLGAWLAIIEVASKQKVRGTLPDGVGGICQCLGRISRLPGGIFQDVLPRLIEIGWIEEVSENQYLEKTLGESPNVVADSANIVAEDGVTGNRRELQGRERNRTVAAPALSWKADEQFCAFVADYLATGAALIDADFAEAWQFCWRALDFQQKRDRVSGMHRHAEEYHANPRFVPKPRKFLESEWARPVRPAPRSVRSESLTDRTMALVKRRIANGEPPL